MKCLRPKKLNDASKALKNEHRLDIKLCEASAALSSLWDMTRLSQAEEESLQTGAGAAGADEIGKKTFLQRDGLELAQEVWVGFC